MRLKEIRKQRGMTAEEVAKEIGVTQAAVANWENGRREPNTATIIKLTEVFGCTADELLGIEKKQEKETT